MPLLGTQSTTLRLSKCHFDDVEWLFWRFQSHILDEKQDNLLIINILSQNSLKCRISLYFQAKKLLIANTRVLEGIVVKIFQNILSKKTS